MQWMGDIDSGWGALTVDGGRMVFIGHGQDRALTSGVALDVV
jgi:hypothetical protein